MLLGLGIGFAAKPPTPLVDDWLDRVAANGGETPSAGLITAIRAFVAAQESAAWWAKTPCLLIFVPNNLAACLTPLKVGGASDPFENVNFSGSDLSVNGLAGNGSSKKLVTGIYPSSFFTSKNSAGVTLINTLGKNEDAIDWGVADSLGTDCSFIGEISIANGNQNFFAWDETTHIYTTANSAFAGYISWNVVAGVPKVYRAKSTLPHEVLLTGSSNADGIVPSSRMINLFDGQLQTGQQFWAPCSKRFSYAAFHKDGLTEAESAAQFAAVYALRTALGGGAP